MVPFDRYGFMLLSLWFSNKSMQAPPCERHKTAQRTLFLLFAKVQKLVFTLQIGDHFFLNLNSESEDGVESGWGVVCNTTCVWAQDKVAGHTPYQVSKNNPKVGEEGGQGRGGGLQLWAFSILLLLALGRGSRDWIHKECEIQSLTSGFSKDFSTLDFAYWFLT